MALPTWTARLPLSLVAGPTCLVSLPLAMHQSEPPIVLELKPLAPHAASGRCVFVGWAGGVSSGHAIEVPATLAESLGLKPPLQLGIKPVNVPVATSLWVRPESDAGWRVAQLEADHLRSCVLMQVFTAAVGQKLPLWVHANECIWVTVLRAEPHAQGASAHSLLLRHIHYGASPVPKYC